MTISTIHTLIKPTIHIMVASTIHTMITSAIHMMTASTSGCVITPMISSMMVSMVERQDMKYTRFGSQGVDNQLDVGV